MILSTMRIAVVCLLAATAFAGLEEGNAMETPDGFPADGTVRLLFIHHSCGGQLLAAPGEKVGGARGSGERCIYVSHPNGGGLRAGLEAAGYEVHELSYESALGEDTDIRHWRAKFAGSMDRLLVTDRQDRVYDDDRTNHVVVFKSCYPNNDFTGPGVEPGNPDAADPDAGTLTVADAKAAYRSLLPIFAEHPDVLFVAFTAPPRAEPKLGFLDRLRAFFHDEPVPADWAREFNGWLAAPDGWLADAPRNVAVFDYYDVLTDGGETNWSAYATGDGTDSHPSRVGNAAAAAAFLPVLDEAVARMRDAR